MKKESEIKLTGESEKLFKAFAEDASNWAGMPLVQSLTKKQQGNLSDLIQKGLIELVEDENQFGQPISFVCFTELGKIKALASYDIDIASMEY